VASWASTGWEGRWRLRAGSRRARRVVFGSMRVSRGAETVVPTVRSRLRAQVFDGDQGDLMGERGRGAAPEGSWGSAELECMVEFDQR
jgi:hypothetical protein